MITEKAKPDQPEGGNDLNLIIATNLRRIRKQQQLSLSELAERSGVSKSMLGQIERNESSPTISTLWKIATGLQVSFTALMEPHSNASSAVKVLNEADLQPVANDHGRFRLFPIVPAQPDRSFEVVDLELQPGAVSASQPHIRGTEEIVLVYEGTLQISLGEQQQKSWLVPSGSVICYPADQHHAYRNAAAGNTRAVMVINYKSKQP